MADSPFGPGKQSLNWYLITSHPISYLCVSVQSYFLADSSLWLLRFHAFPTYPAWVYEDNFKGKSTQSLLVFFVACFWSHCGQALES